MYLPQKEAYNVSLTPTRIPYRSPTPINIDPDKLLSLVNEWRKENNLAPFTKSERLCKIAQIRLPEIKNNWSHSGFSLERFCDNKCYLAENLAKDYWNESEILEAWKHSASHSANLKIRLPYSCIVTDNQHIVEIFGSI